MSDIWSDDPMLDRKIEKWLDNPLGRMYQATAAQIIIIEGIEIIIRILLYVFRKKEK